jgi:hypothetical protein
MATGASTVQELVTLLEAEISPANPTRRRRCSWSMAAASRASRKSAACPAQAIQRTDVLSPSRGPVLRLSAQPAGRELRAAQALPLGGAEAEETSATGGGRSERFGGDLFRLSDENRATVGLEWRQESTLFETERDIVRATSATSPYGLVGNIAASPFGSEIDPALSALAGGLVTLTRAPEAAWDGRGVAGGVRHQRGRSGRLRRHRQPQPLAGAGAGDFQGRDHPRPGPEGQRHGQREPGRRHRTSFLGLPATSVKLPAGSPFSPFAKDVTVYRYLDAPWSQLREADAFKGQLGLAANGYAGEWRWSLTGNYDRNDTETVTGRGVDSTAWKAAIAAKDPAVNPFGPVPRALLKANVRDTAKSKSKAAKAELVLNGDVAEIPAGRISSTVKVGGERITQRSEAIRAGAPTASAYARRAVSVQGDIDLPIASRSHEVLPVLGELSASLNAGYDVQTYKDKLAYGASLHWSPDKLVSVNLSVSQEETAPSSGQVADPVVLTPSVTVFDFATGQSVTVSRVEGGNAGLENDHRRVLRAGVNLRPIGRDGGPLRVTLNANYVRTRIEDPIANFPLITPALEAAFPERFTRNADGVLTAIDSRPLNFDAIDREELRGGINLTRFLGPPPGAKTALKGAAKAAARKQSGQVQLSVNYVWRLRDQTTLRQGLAPLDLLNGASTSRRGQPKRELSFRLNATKADMGATVTGAWRGGSVIDAGPTNGGALRFDDQTTINLSGFYEVPRTVKRKWLAGTRITLAADNLLYSRPIVKDAKGVTPQAYQPDYLDPLGRTVRLTFRKSLIAM